LQQLAQARPTAPPEHHMAREIAAFWRLDRNVRLFLISAALVGMTVLGGIFGVLFNLFILRLGFGTEFVGLVNATGQPSCLGWW
jgi:hypothetical protein